MEEIKHFNMDNFLFILQKQFDTYLMEIAELSNTKNNENRINSFLLNLEIFRGRNVEIKDSMIKKIKIIDRNSHSIIFFKNSKMDAFFSRIFKKKRRKKILSDYSKY